MRDKKYSRLVEGMREKVRRVEDLKYSRLIGSDER